MFIAVFSGFWHWRAFWSRLNRKAQSCEVRKYTVSLKDEIWMKAEVPQRLDERSYLLKDNKRVFRRNRIDLRKVPNKDNSETQEKDNPVTESYQYP